MANLYTRCGSASPLREMLISHNRPRGGGARSSRGGTTGVQRTEIMAWVICAGQIGVRTQCQRCRAGKAHKAAAMNEHARFELQNVMIERRAASEASVYA